MPVSQLEKAIKFRTLHGLTSDVGRPSAPLGPTRLGAFIIPNPWDVGSARMLAALGFEALATTSAGFAFTLGRSDGEVKREEALAHCHIIAEATDLPVSADLVAAGAKRISLGAALSRVALGAFLRAAKEMKDKGTFNFVDDTITSAELSALLKGFASPPPKRADAAKQGGN